MSRIIVQAFITLDGVVQSAGRPDEDREGGFDLGGWQDGYDLGQIVQEWESKTEALLLGRKTYENFANYWGGVPDTAEGFPGELARRYNRIPKYVASRTMREVEWRNSQLLGPDLESEVVRLRSEPGGEIRVWGSTQLVKTLGQHDLIDEYRLAVYPLVLGTGKKLFSDGFALTSLTLLETQALSSGVLINTYRRSHPQ